jgi:EAL domain-containing protein (putative c-di-GMP-specific phosphodiesterase class I)
VFAPGALTTLFQPMFATGGGDRRPFALEVLTRGPVGTNLASSEVLFEYTRRKGMEIAVDRLCLESGLAQAAFLPPGVVLALNVHAATLERDPGFPRYFAELTAAGAWDPARLILELVEHAPAWEGSGLQRSLAALRSLGVRIALDDIGSGHSSYRMILDCHPDFFKVDRAIVHGCHDDFRRRAVLDSVARLAEKLGSRVIAEGIEEPADLETVLALDIDLVQGFLLARPAPARELGGLWSRPA